MNGPAGGDGGGAVSEGGALLVVGLVHRLASRRMAAHNQLHQTQNPWDPDQEQEQSQEDAEALVDKWLSISAQAVAKLGFGGGRPGSTWQQQQEAEGGADGAATPHKHKHKHRKHRSVLWVRGGGGTGRRTQCFDKGVSGVGQPMAAGHVGGHISNLPGH